MGQQFNASCVGLRIQTLSQLGRGCPHRSVQNGEGPVKQVRVGVCLVHSD